MSQSCYARSYKMVQLNYLLRFIIIPIAICGICFACYALSQQQYVYTDGIGGLSDTLFIGSLGSGLLWSIAYLITARVKRSKAPIHPGVMVGVDLMVVLCLLIVGCGLGTGFRFMLGWEFCSGSRYALETCPIEDRILGTEIAAMVMTFIVGTIQFILFVFTCMACHKHKQHKKDERANDYVHELERNESETPKADV